MRWTEKALMRPHQCVMIPHLGDDHPDGYIASGNIMTFLDGEPHVSVVAVREMARLIGLPTAEVHEGVCAEVARLTAELEQERAARAEAEQAVAAVHVLKAAGFKAEKKPGRPPAGAKREAA